MTAKAIAAVIAAELLAERPRKAAEALCFACGRPYMPKPPGQERFCRERCRDVYDAGLPPYDPHYTSKNNPRWYSLPIGRHGFLIPCAGCGKTFDSKGLRCCSIDCERRYREGDETARLMAEVGIERPVKRKCANCGGDIPNWRGGRRVSKATRFCSPQCGKKARRASGGLDGGLGVETMKKCPSNGALSEGPE